MSGDVFYVKQGDNLPSVTTTLLDPLGDPVDLTGATVEFRMVKPGTTVTGAASVDSPPTAGQVTYDWAATDLDEWGGYALEWVVTQGTDVQTFPSDGYNWVEVVPNLTTVIGGVCTLVDVRRELGRALTDPEAVKAIALIEQLTALLERKLNRKFDTVTITETHTWFGRDGRLVLHAGPVIEVTEILLDDVAWTGDLADWEQVHWPKGSEVTVTYNAGSDVDAAVRGTVAQVIARTLIVAPNIAVGAVSGYSVEGTSITFTGGQQDGNVGRFTVADLSSFSRLRRPVFLT